jgi:hypothetical protein
MPTSTLWLVITKSRPLPGCEIDMDGCEFYFADTLVPTEADVGATAAVSAVNRTKDALAEKKLELAEVLVCAKFAPEEWTDQTDAIESIHDLASKALESGALVFSGFRSEEIQELYHYKHTVTEVDE